MLLQVNMQRMVTMDANNIMGALTHLAALSIVLVVVLLLVVVYSS